jgi:hypothetical protein
MSVLNMNPLMIIQIPLIFLGIAKNMDLCRIERFRYRVLAICDPSGGS